MMQLMLRQNWKHYIGLIVTFIIIGLIIPRTFLDILSLVAYPAMLVFFVFFFTVGASKAALKRGSVSVGLNAMSRLVAILPVIVIVIVMFLFNSHYVMNIGSLIVTWFALLFFVQRDVTYQDAGDVLRRAQITTNTGQAVQAPVMSTDYSAAERPSAPVTSAPQSTAPNLNKSAVSQDTDFTSGADRPKE